MSRINNVQELLDWIHDKLWVKHQKETIMSLGIAALLIVCGMYLFWRVTSPSPNEVAQTPLNPSSSSNPTSLIQTPTPNLSTPTPSSNPVTPTLPIPTHTSSNLEPSPSSTLSTPTPTHISAIPLPSPTTPMSSSPVPTSTLLPLPILITGTISENLRVRSGPGTNYETVDFVSPGEVVTLIGRNSDGSWVKIEASIDKWVSASFIQDVLGGKIPDLLIIASPPTPVPTPTRVRPTTDNVLTRGARILGKMHPYTWREYTFIADSHSNVIVLMFRPNTNITFEVYQAGQTQPIGHGSTQNRGGDSNTGTLIWDGGNLTNGTQYHLHLINNSGQVIDYCLATNDVFNWECQ